MSYEFQAEDKEVREFAESIPFGVSEVHFAGAVADATDAGKDFIEVAIISEDGVEDTARLWFTGGAVNISFNTARQIAVHQGQTEEEKQKIRDRFDKVKDSQELADVLNDVCGNGGKLWFTKYYDPTRTYQNGQGQTRKSINKNIYGYEPKLKPELMPAKDIMTGVNPNDYPDDEPFTEGKPASTADKANIPQSW